MKFILIKAVLFVIVSIVSCNNSSDDQIVGVWTYHESEFPSSPSNIVGPDAAFVGGELFLDSSGKFRFTKNDFTSAGNFSYYHGDKILVLLVNGKQEEGTYEVLELTSHKLTLKVIEKVSSCILKSSVEKVVNRQREDVTGERGVRQAKSPLAFSIFIFDNAAAFYFSVGIVRQLFTCCYFPLIKISEPVTGCYFME